MQKKIGITKSGFDSLKKELQKLENVDKPKILEKLHRARSMGDLSENSAYTNALEERGIVEGRILEIREVLKNADIVIKNSNNDFVQLGSKIKVHIDGQKDEIEIVGEFESDPMRKKISSGSPIGKALLGRKKGDQIEITIPSGKIMYKILQIG